MYSETDLICNPTYIYNSLITNNLKYLRKVIHRQTKQSIYMRCDVEMQVMEATEMNFIVQVVNPEEALNIVERRKCST